VSPGVLRTAMDRSSRKKGRRVSASRVLAATGKRLRLGLYNPLDASGSGRVRITFRR